jgi:hypothetical protein
MRTAAGAFFVLACFACIASAATQSSNFTPNPTEVDDASFAMVPRLSFESSDFGCRGGFDITDVNVDVSFDKAQGACGQVPDGDTFLGEISFSITSSGGTRVVLVQNDYSGSGNTSPGVTVTFDQSATTPVGGTPTTGSERPVSGNLDDLNETSLSSVTYTLRAGDNESSDPLCMFSWGVTATANCGKLETPPPAPSTNCD